MIIPYERLMQRLLQEADRNCDAQCDAIQKHFDRSVKYLGVSGITGGLLLMHIFNLGFITYAFFALLPLAVGMCITLCAIEKVLRAYWRRCMQIIGHDSDDDPDPGDEEAIPESPERVDSDIAPFLCDHKKAA